jgi:hypothetical protein
VKRSHSQNALAHLHATNTHSNGKRRKRAIGLSCREHREPYGSDVTTSE